MYGTSYVVLYHIKPWHPRLRYTKLCYVITRCYVTECDVFVVLCFATIRYDMSNHILLCVVLRYPTLRYCNLRYVMSVTLRDALRYVVL